MGMALLYGLPYWSRQIEPLAPCTVWVPCSRSQPSDTSGRVGIRIAPTVLLRIPATAVPTES